MSDRTTNNMKITYFIFISQVLNEKRSITSVMSVPKTHRKAEAEAKAKEEKEEEYGIKTVKSL